MSEAVAVWDGSRWVSIQGSRGEPGRALSIKGTKPTVADLPAPGVEGDLWLVGGDGYAWDASATPPAYVNVGKVQGPAGPQGLKGDKGTDGAKGDAGSSATVAVGNVSTGTAGSTAHVTNTGTASAAILNFTIPAGLTGAAGPAGPAPTLSVVSTTDTANGNPATVSIASTGTGSYGLSFVIPQGAKGAAGASITFRGVAAAWPPPTPANGDVWQIGSPAPAGAPALAGHMVTYDGTTWHDGGMIKGDKGDSGPTAISVDAGNVAKLGADGLLYVPAGATPIATTTTLGGVIVGTGLTVDATGKITADATKVDPATTTTAGTVTLADANAITNKDGTKVVTAAQLVGQVEVKAPLASPTFTGQVTLAAGTAAAPSLTFKGDTDSGVYQVGQDKFDFVTGGSPVMQLGTQMVTFPTGVTIGGSKYPKSTGNQGQVLTVGPSNHLIWAHALTDSPGIVIAKPGDDLVEKYLAALALTPNGRAQDATNRGMLAIMPGEYVLTADLEINTDYCDVIGLGSAPHAPAVRISVDTGHTVHVTAEDVQVTGLDVGTQAFKVDGHPTPTPTQRITNCTGGDNSFGGGGTASGTFTNCTGGDGAFAGIGGIASGAFTGCVGGMNSLGGGGLASGTFTGCTGGHNSFGNTGKYYNCRRTAGAFLPVTGTGMTRNCINADGTIDNQGGFYATDVSTPPTDGQAWVWNAAAKKWKPGSVSSGFLCADGTTQKTLADVAPLLQLFAGCAANQPLKPDGTKAVGMEAVALRSAEFVKTLPDGAVVAFDPDAMVLVYDTVYEADTVVTLPLAISAGSAIDITIDWGDQTAVQTVKAIGNVPHTYAKHGRYIVQIKGNLNAFGTLTCPNRAKLRDVISFGNVGLTSLNYGRRP